MQANEVLLGSCRQCELELLASEARLVKLLLQ
jgi:hypothetical protein